MLWLCCLLMVSCTTQKVDTSASRKETEKVNIRHDQKDSVVAKVKESLKTSVTKTVVPTRVVRITDTLPCPGIAKSGNIDLGNARLIYSLQNNILTLGAIIDSTVNVNQWVEHRIDSLQYKLSALKLQNDSLTKVIQGNTATIEKQKKPLWSMFFDTAVNICLFIGCTWFLYKFLKNE